MAPGMGSYSRQSREGPVIDVFAGAPEGGGSICDRLEEAVAEAIARGRG
jgi:hypothetical protein